MREIGKIFLEHPGGFEVECAGSVAEALELLEEKQFDAIVSDYEMPETNGLEFLKTVRERDPGMPFIIFTGRGSEEVAIEALNNGVDFYIRKGGDSKARFAELRHKITLALDLSRRACPDRTGRRIVSDTGDDGRGAVNRKKREGEISAVEHEFALGIAAATTLDEALPLCVHTAMKISGMDAGGIYLFDEASGDLVLAYATGIDPPFIAATSRLDRDCTMARSIRANRIINGGYDDFEEYYLTAREKEGLKAGIDIPILHNDRVIGCYNLASHTSRTVSPENRMALAAIAAQVGNVIIRIQAEEALKESEERFNLAIEGGNIGIWDWDIQTGEKVYNLQWAGILGYTLTELQGVDNIWEQLVHPEDLPLAKKELDDHFAGKTPYYECYYRMKAKDGRWVWIHDLGKIAAWDEESRPRRMTGIHLDITETQRYRAALRETNRKLNLLSSITRHDILNQITGILGYLGLVEEISRADPRVHRYIERIQMLTGKIQDQIVFTQHYQDLGVKAPRWHCVEEVVRKAADAALSGEFIVSIETGNLEIFADPLLEYVFFNLFDNAKRHGGEVTKLGVSCVVQGGSTSIQVEDDGNGIPESQKGWIFQRGSGTNTGLGLFLVREILGITGISIDETGVEGEGARFEITVPPDAFRYRPAGKPGRVPAAGPAGSNRQINY